jgi:hypothetical protein
MNPTKTRHQREQELLARLATPGGREELEALAIRYGESGGRAWARKKSLITYLIVHERGLGFIEG